MRVVGIDPGLKGGIAIFENGEFQVVYKMPTMPITKTKRRLDVYRLRVRIAGSDLVVVEKSQSFPVMGKVPNFSLGYQFGVIVGMIEGLNRPLEKGYQCASLLVRPQEWKKVILVGYNQKDKSASIDYCLKRFPLLGKLGELTDGEADAICVGLYGLGIWSLRPTELCIESKAQ